MPILCPKEFTYVGIPSTHTVYVQNLGAMIGCFHFLKVMGIESEKIRIRFQPQSGVIMAGTTVEVKVELLVSEIGIFDDLHVPCFIGDPEKLITLKILCSVSDINVYFYLPNENGEQQRILWPPKGYTKLSMDYPAQKYDTEWLPALDRNVPMLEAEDLPEVKTPLPEIDESLQCLIAYDSVAATYPTVKVRSVPIKKPTKIKFYCENITPVRGNFTVEATNYGPEEECLHHILVKAKARSPEYFWEKTCQNNGYGITIEPENNSGDLISYKVVEIELWIYANTWGKYLEEVIVEINDLTPFCFNLIIDVVGSPLEFPFARNTILKYPTIRFKNINCMNNSTRRSFTVTNISSIPVNLSWYVFVLDDENVSFPFNVLIDVDDEEDFIKLELTKEYYGTNACPGCVELSPIKFQLAKQSTATVTITINNCDFLYGCPKQTNLEYNILGFIYLRKEDIFKENYYRRMSGVDIPPAKVNVFVTLELPRLKIQRLTNEDTTISLFVNDILLRQKKDPEIYFLLKNIDRSPIYFSLNIQKPFFIAKLQSVPSGITDPENMVLHQHECLEVLVKCHFNKHELIDLAEFVYKHRYIADVGFTNTICKNLIIGQEGFPRQVIPFEVRLYYPEIKVTPSFVNFGQCVLYKTQKTILSIYNLTGAPVSFEIYKTTQYDDFETNPSYGTINGNTGINKQFVDIAVYFTPRDCRLYIENLKIMTNIPTYYVDVPLTGHGTNNEKFYVS